MFFVVAKSLVVCVFLVGMKENIDSMVEKRVEKKEPLTVCQRFEGDDLQMIEFELRWLDSNQRMQESKSCALPLGDIPLGFFWFLIPFEIP